MIVRFEEHTQDIKPKDMKIVNIVKRGLLTKVGKENAVTSNEIISGMKLIGYDISGAEVRKIVQYLRVNKEIRNLVASSKGYYISNDKEEINEYKKSLMQRITSIQKTLNSFD